ncbi:methionyl-tRNA synthetase [Flavisolibacter ginsengisoli DSM 18119]|jgi:methionyl-tRNA synthetase|uniref:Methionine--tRNA ligase n=1 Tax=Flavisolibacter ginsengisoli DSM 18119 TaxID=1121884 RepID=A0A1M5CU20_9BACT|nr:methionyl-tRNA synthetase [Flavisolibacter ginsengisoli DSM 18119]
MNQPKRYLITSALPYANGQKHIGHLAGAYIPADIYVRYLRAQKRDVVFVCGSDEHGTAIPIQAMKEGTTPREIIDKYHVIMKQNFDDLGISFDIYDRTSNAIHHETTQEFFTYLNDRGELEVKETEQYYDEQAQTFLADRYIKGTCPNCGFESAFGDQCERCGTALSPDELINPVSTLSGNTPIKKLTKHWYLPLNRHEDWLRNWILNEHQKDWKANVLGQCKSWIDAGLQPRAVTRDLDWGVKVPLPDAEGKVLYVWFDAPIGYISATKQWALNTGNDWKPYWQDKDTKLVHFIGKDNIVFHCLIFPVMLHLHNYIVPDNVPANEFMNLEGDKMSTSRNWKLDMQDYIDDFLKKENGGPQMADALRYYLTTILPENKDSEFTWKGFQDAVNGELVAVFANFFNRTFVLMHKLTNGKVPRFHNNIIDEKDKELIAEIESAKPRIEKLLEEYKFRDALFDVIDLARKGNKYMQEKEPWIKAKQVNAEGAILPEVQEQIDNCLHVCLQLCANMAIFINPFLPHTAKKMCQMMKVVDKMLEWENAGKTKLLSVGYSLRAPELLFRKIEDAEVQFQVEKLKKGLAQSKMEQEQNKQPVSQPSSIATTERIPEDKPEIQYDDFAKLDLRIGTITHAEKVEKADKLLKLQVNMGSQIRTIVSGIAQHFKPEDLVDKQVIVVANLAPRKMRGIESQGMILTAEQADGKLILVNPNALAENGSEVR